jgi:hypothetical protein
MMRFLKSFFLILRESFRKADSGVETEVGNDENLSHFIFSRTWFSPNTARVKYNAFMPRKGEVSVFRIDKLSEKQVWTIGRDVVGGGTKNPKARGDIKAAKVRESQLDVLAAEPPPRHANLVGWPSAKSEQILIAKQLAARAILKLRE